MKDWAVAFIAAVLLVGLTVWCVKIFIWSLNVGFWR
jgi:hypothetical protein